MKIAVVYNRESLNVINLFGIPNREKYGIANIKRIVDSLKKGGHSVKTFEGDKFLIEKLEKFMPRVVKGEVPGMVFNVSYGIQGKARYTHVPGILEMVGVPYIGSNPLAHSLALDKVVTKMILIQNNLPTPDFIVMEHPDAEIDISSYPVIVKPKNEAVSFGLKIVHNEEELREAASVIYSMFGQSILVEQYIEGKEINVGLIGNNPPETLPPVEIVFTEGGPPIYTYEDKTKQSDREIIQRCPADIPSDVREKAEELSKKAFSALGCYDFARVDMRIDKDNNVYILEVNSLASLGQNGSYVLAAKNAGLDYAALINRIVETTSTRYFGTPRPSTINTENKTQKENVAFSYLIQRRDLIEKRLEKWCKISSRTLDPVGIKIAVQEFSKIMDEMSLKPVDDYQGDNFVWLWETKPGFENGVLLVCHIDVPFKTHMLTHSFRRDPEYLYGEGIGTSRAPLVMLEYALRALRTNKLLRKIPLGILLYSDEGMDARFSEKAISNIMKKANQVLVLRPGNVGDKCINQRRGLVNYSLVVEGKPMRLGQSGKTVDSLIWVSERISELSQLSNRNKKLAISSSDIKVESFPMLLPHRITVSLLINYFDPDILEETVIEMKKILKTRLLKWELEEIYNRPPLQDKKINKMLFDTFKKLADENEITFETTSSLWPSVAGLAPSRVPVLCGIGPVAENIYTPQEAVNRLSLIQRTLLLTQYLLHQIESKA